MYIYKCVMRVLTVQHRSYKWNASLKILEFVMMPTLSSLTVQEFLILVSCGANNGDTVDIMTTLWFQHLMPRPRGRIMGYPIRILGKNYPKISTARWVTVTSYLSVMASQIIRNSITCAAACSRYQQRKHQSSTPS